MRKGKRRAVHTFGEISEIRGDGPFTISVEKSIVGGVLCILETKEKIKKGAVWIVIAPLKGKPGKSEEEAVMALTSLQESGDREITAVFESREGPHKRAEVTLDNRGRAKNLEVGEDYTFGVMEPEKFFQAYEMKSIPTGGSGRSEPDEAGKKRIELFTDLSGAKEGQCVLDCATGIKGYLKHFAKKGSTLVCLNVSIPVLKRTREWLDNNDAYFVRYDADQGFPFKDKRFDIIVVDALLEYVKEPHTVLKRCAALTKPGGSILLLEPAFTETHTEFYPMDLWEVALWRPLYDKGFSRLAFEDTLKNEKFELAERRIIDFEYPLFSQQRFSQGIAAFKKTFIS
jgi:SAM-dependent methyltransferase